MLEEQADMKAPSPALGAKGMSCFLDNVSACWTRTRGNMQRKVTQLGGEGGKYAKVTGIELRWSGGEGTQRMAK